MGRQINFFLHHNDQQEYDELLRTFDNIVFIPYYQSAENLTTIEKTIVQNSENEGLKIYLARKQDLEKIKLRFIVKQNYWLIDSSSSPVVEFSRCYNDEKRIRRGRLYFQTKFVSENHLTEKPVDFIKWADKILWSFRNKLKKINSKEKPDSSSYIGKNAADWLRENSGQFNKPGTELLIKHSR